MENESLKKEQEKNITKKGFLFKKISGEDYVKNNDSLKSDFAKHFNCSEDEIAIGDVVFESSIENDFLSFYK